MVPCTFARYFDVWYSDVINLKIKPNHYMAIVSENLGLLKLNWNFYKNEGVLKTKLRSLEENAELCQGSDKMCKGSFSNVKRRWGDSHFYFSSDYAVTDLETNLSPTNFDLGYSFLFIFKWYYTLS